MINEEEIPLLLHQQQQQQQQRESTKERLDVLNNDLFSTKKWILLPSISLVLLFVIVICSTPTDFHFGSFIELLSLSSIYKGWDNINVQLQPFEPYKYIQNNQSYYHHQQSQQFIDECIYRPSKIQVERNKDGFPSFWNYYNNFDHSRIGNDCITSHDLRPINVSYNKRSIIINNENVMLLGGSMHPSRLTYYTWNMALDEAVHQGLNLITIYIIWSSHQPIYKNSFNFILQTNVSCRAIQYGYQEYHNNKNTEDDKRCDWDIQQMIRDVANRGLFVHLRIGPYICGEYSYGGIPEWVPILYPDVSMRRYNTIWMNKIMKPYITMILQYIQRYQLFAYQGGPIIMVQIENEIGNDGSTDYESDDNDVEKLQLYADWCGTIVQDIIPHSDENIVLTMCSGLVANNTISTYNGFFVDISWLEDNGNTKRIQIDQPALWTEHEGI
jgi:hypothetical protein